MRVDEEVMYSMNALYMQVMKKPCILCGTIYMQVDEEACLRGTISTCKGMKNLCILCGTIYMQVDEEAHLFYAEQSTCNG